MPPICFPPDPFLADELAWITPTPARHAKQGLYLANRGFVSKHLGHIGRWQHFVMNSSESSTFGGNDEEHARHSVVLRSNIIPRPFPGTLRAAVVSVRVGVGVRSNPKSSAEWLHCDRHSDVPRFSGRSTRPPSHLSQIAPCSGFGARRMHFARR